MCTTVLIVCIAFIAGAMLLHCIARLDCYCLYIAPVHCHYFVFFALGHFIVYDVRITFFFQIVIAGVLSLIFLALV